MGPMLLIVMALLYPFIMDWNYSVVHKTLMNNLNLAVLHIGQQKSYLGQGKCSIQNGTESCCTCTVLVIVQYT